MMGVRGKSIVVWLWILVFLLVVVVLFLYFSGFIMELFINVMIWFIVIYGFNVLLGYIGQLLLVYVGFFGIGVYMVGILMFKYGWSFWVVWLLVVVLCVFGGLLLGLVVFCIKGDVFFIFIFGVGVIIQQVINKWDVLIGGNDGFNGIVLFVGFDIFVYGLGFKFNGGFYLLVLFVFVFMVLVVVWVWYSVFGCLLFVIWGGEDFVCSVGIDVFGYKLWVMMFFIVIVGFVGGLYVVYVGFFGLVVIGLVIIFIMLFYLFVGGVGMLFGLLFGIVLMYGLIQFFKDLQDYQYIVFGLLLVLLVMFMLQGFVGLWEKVCVWCCLVFVFFVVEVSYD